MIDFLTSTTGILIVFIALVLTRELWTWFFKLNKLTSQNQEIIRLLRKLANEPEPLTGYEKTGRSLGQFFRRKKN